MPQHDLYAQVQRESARHQREYQRYLDMLTSGFTHGRFYSEQELAEQLAKADAAMEAGEAALQAYHEAAVPGVVQRGKTRRH